MVWLWSVTITFFLSILNTFFFFFIIKITKCSEFWLSKWKILEFAVYNNRPAPLNALKEKTPTVIPRYSVDFGAHWKSTLYQNLPYIESTQITMENDKKRQK